MIMDRALLDRSVISHIYKDLAGGLSWRLQRIKAACAGFAQLCYEPEGTSALDDVMARCSWLKGKIRPVNFHSAVRLSPAQQAALTASLQRLEQIPAIQHAVQEFNVAATGPARETAAVLGYVFRLALLARSSESALLCWHPRANLIRSILETESAGTAEAAIGDGLVGSLFTPSAFPFGPDDDAEPFRHTVFDYGKPLPSCSIFLSHSAADKEFVRKLATDLAAAQMRVWLDEADIDPGDSFVARIEDGLVHSDFMMLVLSPDSVRSPWVQTELRIAIARECQGKSPKVIPILWRDCEIPPILSDRYYVDVRTEEKYHAALEALFERMGLGEREGFG